MDNDYGGSMKNSLKVFMSCFFVVFIFATTGCDFIDSAKTYLFGGNEKVTKIENQKQKGVKNDDKIVERNGDLSDFEVVRVDNWRLTVSEFNEKMDSLAEALEDFDKNSVESKKLVVDELVRQELLVADAVKRNLLDFKNIDAAVEEFRRTLIVRQMADKVTKDVKVSEDEIKSFYEENKKELVTLLEMKVRSIIVDDRLKAKELLIQILQGGDFAQLAKEHSKGSNAAKGGDMGWISEVPFPEMANAIIPLKKGDVSGVFSGTDGFYIVKVDDRRGGEVVAFDQVKEEIEKNRMVFKQQNAIVEYINVLKKKAVVEINDGFFLK